MRFLFAVLFLLFTSLGANADRNLLLNLPAVEVERANRVLGTALRREGLVDLIQDRLIQDFGWGGLVYLGDQYTEGRELYQPTSDFFPLNGIFSFEELVYGGRRVGGISSGHSARVSIPEVSRLALAKNLSPEQIENLLSNLILHEWIGHGISDSSVFHGSPPMGPSIRGMFPGIVQEVFHFQRLEWNDFQIYRKIRLNLDCS